jgi:hypothetical protein
MGKDFRLAEKVGLMPLLSFAALAEAGVDTMDFRALATMYHLLQQIIHPDDWGRFQSHASEVRADADDLLGVVTLGLEAVSGRPSGPSNDSSAGPGTTSQSSLDGSTSKVLSRLQTRGDLQLAIPDIQQRLASSGS